MNTITKETKVLEPTPDEAIKWLEKTQGKAVELVYIDYRDQIEDAKQREALLQDPSNEWEALNMDSWVCDSQYESINYLMKEFEESFNSEDAEIEIPDETKDAFQQWCFDHDNSDIVDQLLKNTGSEYMYYDTGLSFDSLDYAQDQDKEIEKRTKAICKKLKLDYEKNKKDISLMAGQAWYGGQLVILFENNISEFLHEAKYIKFNKDAEICLMDRGNGSGDSCGYTGELLLRFKRENIHSDQGDNGYSYAYDVCGLVGNIMNDGVLTNKRNGMKVIEVATNEERTAQRERENEYIKSWNNGRGTCTFGDMNFKRHKDKPYRNDYPCGNKCEACGTFWVD